MESRNHPSPRDWAVETDAAIYRISHDLGAAIRSLTHLSGWVAEDIEQAGYDLPKAARDNITMLQSRADRLQTMLVDLLTFSVIGQGGPPIQGDWHNLVRDIAATIAGRQNFEIITSGEATPSINATDFSYLLSALLSNAVKHHNRDAGKIWVTCQSDVVQVADDGPGIPHDQWQNACKVMTTLKSRDLVEGSGMGLAICNKIARHYGGDIAMTTSEGGRGCCITMRFDRA